ncbi:Protein CBR-NHR-33 [Caenorhabditis briggsae]|uniref:Protein CBR-NHR-33 n=1 Tax=Caenorhabditis briggsae TaxID=6238 RepID=A8XQW9_CAEBR|nr:Protein CBR-NHR-33 [Caenorhabditis briggsae]CAP35044.2 Protein CBR-NHR-33 [Caenorhabditis briggsae]
MFTPSGTSIPHSFPDHIIRPIPQYSPGVVIQTIQQIPESTPQGNTPQGIIPQADTVEEREDCKICFQIADGVHFGVASCRACAAFFRRTVIMKLKYMCKDKGNCTVEKSLRNLCRSCRYTRCLNEGMKIECKSTKQGSVSFFDLFTVVQLQRDSIGKKKSVGNTSVDLLFTPNVASSLSAVFKKDKEESLTPECTILSQMSCGYDFFLKFRKSTNTLVQSTVITPTFRIPKIELHASRFDSAKQVSKVEAHLVTDIVNTYFSPFNVLKFKDKVALFKNFFCYFSHTDRAYQSYKQFENDNVNDKILMPDGGFIKRTELGRFYENAEGVHTSAEDAAQIFQPVFNYILDVIVDYMRRIHIIEIEYLAILGFCLWDDAVPGLSKEAKSLAVRTQSQILAELQSYYASKKCVIMLRENSVLAELFNYYEADVCCKNFKEDASVDLDCKAECIVHSKNE